MTNNFNFICEYYNKETIWDLLPTSKRKYTITQDLLELQELEHLEDLSDAFSYMIEELEEYDGCEIQKSNCYEALQVIQILLS